MLVVEVVGRLCLDPKDLGLFMFLLKTELLSGSRVLRSLNGIQEQSVALMGSGNKIFFLCRELMQTKEVLL